MKSFRCLLLLVHFFSPISSQTEVKCASCPTPAIIPTDEVYPTNQCFDADTSSVSRLAMFRQADAYDCVLVISGCQGVDVETPDGGCQYLDTQPIVFFCFNGTYMDESATISISRIRCNW